MYSISRLAIRGYRGESVPVTFFQQSVGSKHVAILLPGISYTCQMPLMYYLTGLFLGMNADALWVEYAYAQRRDFRTLPDDEQERWLLADVTAAWHAALAKGSYSTITLCGKSIGTIAMGHLLSTDSRLAPARAVWLTPVLKDERLRSQILATKQRSLLVIGTADANYDAGFVKKLEALGNWDVVVLEGADHSLEIKDDVFRSLPVMEQVMRRIHTFLSN